MHDLNPSPSAPFRGGFGSLLMNLQNISIFKRMMVKADNLAIYTRSHHPLPIYFLLPLNFNHFPLSPPSPLLP